MLLLYEKGFDERNLLHGYWRLPGKKRNDSECSHLYQIMITFPKVCKAVKLFEKFLITPGFPECKTALAQSCGRSAGILRQQIRLAAEIQDQIIIPHIQQAGQSIRRQIRIIIHAVQAEVKKLCL